MARYENLPIFKKSMELAVYLEQIVKSLPRYHKYAIGSDMRKLSREIVALVIKANSRMEKVSELGDLRDKCEEMKYLITLGKELKVFKSFKQFEWAACLSVDLCRQSEGWLGNQRKKRPES